MTLYQILSYAIRVRCPNRPVRASSDIGWFLSGISVPLPGTARKGLRALPCKVLGRSLLKRSGDRFSVLSPAAGSVCNLPSQRALYSAGRTHLPPQNAEIIPRSPAPRQLPAPSQTGTRCRTRGAKMQIPHRVCKHGEESLLAHQLTSELTSTPLGGG